MKVLMYYLICSFCIIYSTCGQNNSKVLENLKIVNVERNADQNIINVDLSFRYKKGIENIGFVYLTFAETSSCIGENLISKKSKILENLSIRNGKIFYKVDLAKFGIKSVDYARLKLSDIEGEYSNDIEVGDREEYYSKCK